MRKDILKAIRDYGVTEGMGDAGRLYDIQQHPVELARFLAEMDKRGITLKGVGRTDAVEALSSWAALRARLVAKGAQ